MPIKQKRKVFKIEDMDDSGDYDKKFKYKIRMSRIDGTGQTEVDDHVLYLWEPASELDENYDGWETSAGLQYKPQPRTKILP